MPVQQGDLSLLQHPVAQELLASKIPARLAYIWTDGTPRVVPIWFHWDSRELVMGTPPKAPKLKALAKNPKVSITIDDDHFPHKVLLIRGAPVCNQSTALFLNTPRRRNATSGRSKARRGSSNCRAWCPRWYASASLPNGSASWTSKLASPARWPDEPRVGRVAQQA